MTPAARQRLEVRAPILIVSAAAWMLLILRPHDASAHAHCSGLLATNSPGQWGRWALMLVGMMGPLLVAPVLHVRERSFARRRTRGIALFVLGYGAIWMLAAVVLMPLASYLTVASGAAIALLWQWSPLKQRALNRGHGHPELAAFGAAADAAALRFGLTHGAWCLASCWALMLLPFLVVHGHLVAMAVVTLWLIAEKLDRPAKPRWSMRLPLKATRLLVYLSESGFSCLGGCRRISW